MPVSVKPRKNLVACRQSDVVPLPEEEAHEKTGIILDQTLTDCDKAKAKHAYRKPKLSESSPISIPPSTQLGEGPEGMEGWTDPNEKRLTWGLSFLSKTLEGISKRI